MSLFGHAKPKKVATRVNIAWATGRHKGGILAVESARREPWTAEDVRQVCCTPNQIAMVAEWRGNPAERPPVAGWMLYRLESRRIVLLRLGVHPTFRGRGVGRAMLAELAGKLSAHRRTRVVTVADERDTDGHHFLAACGFQAVAVERGAFGDHDGYRFMLDVTVARHMTFYPSEDAR